jgi:RNA polymerase sigma factor (sigma-70 family)
MQEVVTVDARRRDGKDEGDALLVEYAQRYRPLIERLCRILLGDSGEAEDVAQQTFLLAYQSLLAGTRPRQPRAWLCTIARRECWARTHRIRREHTRPRMQSPPQLDPAEQSLLRADLELLSAGLMKLPLRQRRAIVLRELVGLSYSQLATALDVSESAAEALLVRARRSLRRGRTALLLLPFPPRRALRLVRDAAGRGHARATMAVNAAKAVAVGTLVAATIAVAGAASPVEHPAEPVAHAGARAVRAAPLPGPRPEKRPVPAPTRQTPRVHARPPSRHHAEPAAPSLPTTPHAPIVSGTPSSTAPPPAPEPPQTRRTATEPKIDRTSHATVPRPHPRPRPRPQPRTSPSPPAPSPQTNPDTTTTGTDPADTTPEAPAETTETPAEPVPQESSAPAADDQGDSRPGNGYGDDKHDHVKKR